MKIREFQTLLDEGGIPYLAERGSFRADGRKSYHTPDDLADFVTTAIGLQNYAEESVWLLCFDSRLHLIGCHEASRGSCTNSMVPIREIMTKALLTGSSAIALAHCHPGNDPTPSAEDVEATKRVVEAAKTVGIKVVDHVVVARCGWSSLRDRGLVDFA